MRIQYDPDRIVPVRPSRRQPGIVGRGGFRADQHCVAERPHPVEVQRVLRAGHVIGITRAGCDESIEPLTQVPHREWGFRGGITDR